MMLSEYSGVSSRTVNGAAAVFASRKHAVPICLTTHHFVWRRCSCVLTPSQMDEMDDDEKTESIQDFLQGAAVCAAHPVVVSHGLFNNIKYRSVILFKLVRTIS